MKGEKIMNRLMLLMMTAIKPRFLLLTAFAVAVTVLVSGINVTYAEQGSHDAQLEARKAARDRQLPSALQERYAAKRAADAKKARDNRAVIVNRRKAQIDYTRKVLEGQGNAPAPDTGGAK